MSIFINLDAKDITVEISPTINEVVIYNKETGESLLWVEVNETSKGYRLSIDMNNIRTKPTPTLPDNTMFSITPRDLSKLVSCINMLSATPFDVLARECIKILKDSEVK